MVSARIDTKFQGYKDVPPGLHCLTWQAASHSEEMITTGLRTALFLYTSSEQTVAREYHQRADAWHTIGHVDDHADVIVSPEYLETIERQLAPYASDPPWRSLVIRLNTNPITFYRVFQCTSNTDASCDSFSSLAEHEDFTSDQELRQTFPKQQGIPLSSGTTHPRTQDARDDVNILVEGAHSDHESDKTSSSDDHSSSTHIPHSGMDQLHFTPFPLQRSWPPEARGIERTRYSQDKSWLLDQVIKRAQAADHAYARSLARGNTINDSAEHDALLREMELVFVLFQQVNNADACNHWLALITLFCRTASRLGAPEIYAMHPCEWQPELPDHAPQLEAHIAFLQLLTTQMRVLHENLWTDQLPVEQDRLLTDLAELRSNMARALGAYAATHKDSPSLAYQPHDKLIHAWSAFSATTKDRFQWTLDASLDEETEALNEVEHGEDAPVFRKSGGIFKAHTRLNKAPAKLRAYDYAERNGYVRGLVKEIIHDAGR
ncbi:hypothetical protein MYAM1_002784 [Malassezia yamatoensis]|uniref:Uncharacterized protein n=1 Tax=Malassezia yamatoensis TaxID=253288 RepID=A0AAJ5YUJ8_9BASI|nr:hypothetical protein MYAM1_002784 [Malassezia yamatoensis]